MLSQPMGEQTPPDAGLCVADMAAISQTAAQQVVYLLQGYSWNLTGSLLGALFSDAEGSGGLLPLGN